jgi:hypothetical protein
VWIVLDEQHPETHLLFPLNLDYEPALFAFLEKADAEHWARLIKQYAPDFGDIELIVTDEPLSELGPGSVESKRLFVF